MTITPGWPVAIALVALVALTLATHRLSRRGLARDTLVATARAVLQLGAAAFVITVVVRDLWASVALLLVMFATAVWTTARRVDALPAWPYAALAMACGLVPVLGIILGTGAIPLTGIALIPTAGILMGNAMTGHTLFGQRAFDAIRDERDQYDAYLSVGLLPSDAIGEIIHRRVPQALLPDIDKVRSAGVVTLPGAFIGVLLGGGSPAQAAAAQLLVLFGILATQALTASVAEQLARRRLLLPSDLRDSLPR